MSDEDLYLNASMNLESNDMALIPGDIFRVFERGGRNILSLFPETGNPNIAGNIQRLEEPGDLERGAMASQRLQPVQNETPSAI